MSKVYNYAYTITNNPSTILISNGLHNKSYRRSMMMMYQISSEHEIFKRMKIKLCFNEIDRTVRNGGHGQ